jgi:hypothetical protein
MYTCNYESQKQLDAKLINGGNVEEEGKSIPNLFISHVHAIIGLTSLDY